MWPGRSGPGSMACPNRVTKDELRHAKGAAEAHERPTPKRRLIPSLWNHDLAPTTPAQRTWGRWHIAALWVGMAVCIPTYTLAAGLLASGMSWFGATMTRSSATPSCWCR